MWDWMDIFVFKNWVVRVVAGKLLMVTGALGIGMNIYYDKIVTRPVIEYGWVQVIAFIYFGAHIVLGYWWDEIAKED